MVALLGEKAVQCPAVIGQPRMLTDGVLTSGWLPPEPILSQGSWGFSHVSPHGPCQRPVKDFLTFLGSGICIPIILLTQPIQVWSCLALKKGLWDHLPWHLIQKIRMQDSERGSDASSEVSQPALPHHH